MKVYKTVFSIFMFGLVFTSLFFFFPHPKVHARETDNRIGCFKYTAALRFGDGVHNGKSDLVTTLQTDLQQKGYFTGTKTGYLGLKTFRAVKQYQKAYGIPQTGFVGPLTRGKLRADFCSTSTTQIDSLTCSVYFDGCNTCSKSSPKGVEACTMMACTGQTAAPYCKVYFDNAVKACPEEKIVNKQPVMCISAPCPPIEDTYYIYQGTRHEIKEFDASYVSQNCQVKTTEVY